MTTRPVSNFGKVRAWLATQDGPRMTSQIAEGLGLPGDIKVAWWIGCMRRGGQLDRIVVDGRSRYFVAREVITGRMSDEEARLRKNERERRRCALRGGKSLEEYRKSLADAQAARHAETAAKKEAKRLARLQPRARKVRTPKVKPAAKPATKLLVVPNGPRRAVQVEPETVEQWMARTQQKPEVLPHRFDSQPLKFVGDAADSRTKRNNQGSRA